MRETASVVGRFRVRFTESSQSTRSQLMSVRWLLIAILLFTPAAVHAQDKKKGKKKVEPKPFVAESTVVPYRLTDTHHTLVRVKINGKGPFNFVVDTGCPVFLIAEP